jgi:hypothetical protein
MATIDVNVGVSRNELATPGYAFTRLASNYRFAYMPSPLAAIRAGTPDGVWQEPNTGVIMLRPNCFRSGFRESPLHKIGRIGIDQLFLAENPSSRSAFLAVHTDTGRKVLAREHNTSILWLLPKLAEQAILDKLAGVGEEMAVAWRTKEPLLMNEGFGAIITPTGVSDDRADNYYAFIFGDRYCLNILMSGAADVYERVRLEPDDPESTEWVFRDRYNFGSAGVDHTQPFMVCVIPWGETYISITFTQTQSAPLGGAFMATRGAGDRRAAFLIDLKQWGHDAEWHEGQKQWQKTKPAHLAVAIRKDVHMYDDAPFRIRYTSEAAFALMPEHLPQPFPDVFPQVVAFGYVGHKEPEQPRPTRIDVEYRNNLGAEWDPVTDTKLVVTMELTPSENGVYTPELWWHTVEFDRVIHQPELSVAQLPWRYLRIQKTCGLNASECNVKIYDDTYYEQLLRRGQPLQVTVRPANGGDPIPVWDGYVDMVQPDTIGATQLEDLSLPPDPVTNKQLARIRVQSEMSGYDMWDRLESTPVQDTLPFTNKRLGETLVKLLRAAGFEDSDIELVDADDLNAIVIDPVTEPGAVESFEADMLVADAIRQLLARYQIQGESLIRVRWVGDKWKIYFAPSYDPSSTNILKVFHLDHTLIPLRDGDIGRSDIERWFPPEGPEGLEHYYIKAEGNFEADVVQPEFNAAKFVSSTGSSDRAEKLEFWIPPHPDVIETPESPIFEGRVRSAILGPPVVTAQSMLALQTQARGIYGATQARTVQAVFPGEWQPPVTIEDRTYGLDVDDLIAIVGRNTDGEPVSYGVWRIEAMDIEVRTDAAIKSKTGEDDIGHTYWDRHADYTVGYVGPTTSETFALDFPMFSDQLPLFEGWPPEE